MQNVNFEMRKIAVKRLKLPKQALLAMNQHSEGEKLARSPLFASLVSCQDANVARYDLAHEGVQVVLPGGRLLKERFEENKGDSGS